jgi:hypothetical protein
MLKGAIIETKRHNLPHTNLYKWNNNNNKLYQEDNIVTRLIWAMSKTQVDSTGLYILLPLKVAFYTMENKRISIDFVGVKKYKRSIYVIYLSYFFFRLNNSTQENYC